VLLRHYARLAAEQDIGFTVQAELGRNIGIVDSDLCSVLSNLLENAVEACKRMSSGERFINITIAQKKSTLSIYLENSVDKDTIRNRGSRFYSAKEPGRIGYGLSSVGAIAGRYNGEAAFVFDETRNVFISTVLLISSV
jgi:sensor histidine kinase YesM